MILNYPELAYYRGKQPKRENKKTKNKKNYQMKKLKLSEACHPAIHSLTHSLDSLIDVCLYRYRFYIQIPDDANVLSIASHSTLDAKRCRSLMAF